MELFLLLSELQSKNSFFKIFPTFDNESKIGFKNRKENFFLLSELHLTLISLGGGNISPPVFKIIIALEPNVRLTSNQAVNSS